MRREDHPGLDCRLRLFLEIAPPIWLTRLRASFSRREAGCRKEISRNTSIGEWQAAPEIDDLLQKITHLWSGALPIAKDFPVWGTGYGTYQYVDPLYRADTTLGGHLVDHVHNDYLEMLVEGGLVGLLLSLLAIGLVFRLGLRAMRQGHSSGGLALGALFALTTVVIHSFGDFGIHVPAITLLIIVLCAQLCSIGSQAPRPVHDSSEKISTDGQEYVLRLCGLAPVLGAATCIALGLIVFRAGWRLHAADSLRFKALQAGRTTLVDRLERKIDFLEIVARLTPGDAEVRLELGQALSELFDQNRGTLDHKLMDMAAVVLLPSSSFSIGAVSPLVGVLASLEMGSTGRRDLEEAQEKRLARQYLVPAFEQFRLARDQCPLLPGPQAAGLGSFAGSLVRRPFACLHSPTSASVPLQSRALVSLRQPGTPQWKT